MQNTLSETQAHVSMECQQNAIEWPAPKPAQGVVNRTSFCQGGEQMVTNGDLCCNVAPSDHSMQIMKLWQLVALRV